MVNIAIIILNWNRPDLTIDTVESVLKINQKSFKYKILLVDNGSSDNSLEIFTQKYQKNNHIKVLTTNRNLGFVGGNNFGIRYSQKNNFDYVLLLNNDVLVDPDFLEILLKKSLNKFDISAPKIYFAPGFEFHQDRYSKKEIGKVIWFAGGQIDWNNIYGSHIGVDQVDQGQFDQISEDCDFLTGCCMLIKIEVFQKIGLLDDKFFMYLEDADFCQRAKRNNFKLAFIPFSKIWHINAGSSKSGGDLQQYFLTRNRLLFGLRYATLKTKLALLKQSFFQILSKDTPKWQRQGILDFYLRKFAKGSWQ